MSKHIIEYSKLERDAMKRNSREIPGFMMPSSSPQDHQAPISDAFRNVLDQEAKKIDLLLKLTEQGVGTETAFRTAFPVREQAD